MDGRTHRRVGVVVGLGAVAAYRIAEYKTPRLGEIAGAVAGGMLGAQMPDVLEPATNSYHRGLAHSAAVSTGGAAGAFHVLRNLRPRLDAKADELRERSASKSGLERLLLALCALLIDFLNGLATAFVPAYVSHIALDATTPRGIPLIA